MSVILCQDRLIGRGALDAVPEVAARHGLGENIMLVCDDTTYVAAGQRLHTATMHTRPVVPHSIGRRPHASMALAEGVVGKANGMTGIIAVGAGTVNDVSKYAAHLLGIPYISVATAASMNGYSSATASLDQLGMKLSFEAVPPRAVVADLDVIAAAPKRLARAGVGDTLCRTTVEADCLLSHVLLGTPYPRHDFDLMRRHEDALLADIALLKESSYDYLALLMTALLDAGDAMARVGSSITASQGEHMIAHTLEIMYRKEVDLLHGELISVTTVTMNDLQNKLILSQPLVRPLPRDEAYFSRVFGRKMGAHVVSKYAPKVLNQQQVIEINDRLAVAWTELKQQLAEVVMPTSSLMRAFMRANIPTKPQDVRVNDERYSAAVTNAYLTRNRFTFLDVAAMMGRRV